MWGTPVHHPFVDGIFHDINLPAIGVPYQTWQRHQGVGAGEGKASGQVAASAWLRWLIAMDWFVGENLNRKPMGFSHEIWGFPVNIRYPLYIYHLVI